MYIMKTSSTATIFLLKKIIEKGIKTIQQQLLTKGKTKINRKGIKTIQQHERLLAQAGVQS